MLEKKIYRRAEPVLSELKSEYQNCTCWAVIIGISEYKHQRWNLQYAHRDADELYKLLLTDNGGRFEKEHIRKLTNQEATTQSIKSAITTFLQKPATEDLVLIYFACHGSPDPNRPQYLYLLTHDTNPDDLPATALAMDEIENSIKKNLLAEKVIILADTCHSGAIMSQGRRSPIDRSQLMNQYLTNLSQAKAGIASFTSAESKQVAQEGERWGGGHGVFTYHLLEGMRGKADKDKNQIVTIGELFEYVRDCVKQDTDDQQHPVISGDFDRYLPIAITPESIAEQYKKEELELYRNRQLNEAISKKEEGLELYHNGQLNEAISKMEEAVRLDPNNGKYYFLLGDMLYKQGSLNQAIKTYQKGFDLGEKDAAVYSHVGFIFYTLKRFDEAIKACKQAISIDPKMSEAYVCLGAVFHQQGRLEEAVLNYKQAIKINTDSFEAHLRLGQVLFDQKKLDEAVTELQKASRIDPNQPAVWCHLGIVFYEKGDNVSAVKNLQTAIPLLIKNKETQQAEKIQSFVNQIKAEKN